MLYKKILVVGGAGYIGSLVNKMLEREGFKTLVLDNLQCGHWNATDSHFIEGNMGDRSLLKKIFTEHEIGAVMHFASLIRVGESVVDPGKYYENNVSQTVSLLQAMVQHSVKNIIFSSSAAIFGQPQSKLIGEEHPKSPINPYGRTKWMIEQILADFDSAYGLRSSCLRYFNAAGGDPEGKVKLQSTKGQNLIPILLNSLKKPNAQVPIYGTDYETPDGTCVRDFIHVHDLGSAHLLALRQLLEKEASTSYNLGNGEGYSVREVIKAVETVTGLKVNCVAAPRRPGDPPFLVAETTKAKQELGWRPVYPDLHSMVRHAWQGISS